MKGTSRGAGRSRREFNWTGAAAEEEARTGTRRREEEGRPSTASTAAASMAAATRTRGIPASASSASEAELEERKSAGAHTAEAMTALNRALRLAPGHILAAHMLVHLTESLPPPRLRPAVDGERGESDPDEDPDRVGIDGGPDRAELVPHRGAGRDGGGFARVALARNAGVSPHLAHMAAHTYVRVGRRETRLNFQNRHRRRRSRSSLICVYPYGARPLRRHARLRGRAMAGARPPRPRRDRLEARSRGRDAGLTSGF